MQTEISNPELVSPEVKKKSFDDRLQALEDSLSDVVEKKHSAVIPALRDFVNKRRDLVKVRDDIKGYFSWQAQLQRVRLSGKFLRPEFPSYDLAKINPKPGTSETVSAVAAYLDTPAAIKYNIQEAKASERGLSDVQKVQLILDMDVQIKELDKFFTEAAQLNFDEE